MRVLWEIQRSLLQTAAENPGSASLIMLCMLGFPSLHVSRIENCPPMCHFKAACIFSGEGNRDLAVSIDSSEDVEASETSFVQSEPEARSVPKSNARRYLCYKIDIAGAAASVHCVPF